MGDVPRELVGSVSVWESRIVEPRTSISRGQSPSLSARAAPGKVISGFRITPPYLPTNGTSLRGHPCCTPAVPRNDAGRWHLTQGLPMQRLL
jgi:hypothetical protein